MIPVYGNKKRCMPCSDARFEEQREAREQMRMLRRRERRAEQRKLDVDAAAD